MRAAILCPGPSLQYYLRVRPPADVFIGVNEAVEAAHCHWWSCVDWEPFTRHTPIGDPVRFTKEINRRRVLYHLKVPENEHRTSEQYRGWLLHEEVSGGARATTCPPDGKWGARSAMAAIVLAEWLGAGEIVMYGADMDGRDSYNGAPEHAVSRSARRWKEELEKLTAIVDWLQANGVTFCRNINGKQVCP